MAGVYGGQSYPYNSALGVVNDAWFQTGFTAQSLIAPSGTFYSSSEAGPATTDAAKAPTIEKKTPETKDE